MDARIGLQRAAAGPTACNFRELRFLHSIAVASRTGNTNGLHWWQTKYLSVYSDDLAILIARTATFRSHLHLLKWLYDVDGHAGYRSRANASGLLDRRYRSLGDRTSVRFANGRSLEGSREFIQGGPNPTADYTGAFQAAAEAGHLHVGKHLLLQDTVDQKAIEKAYRKAFNNGHSLVLERFLSKDQELEHQCWINRAMKRDIALTTIKWFMEEHQ